MPPDASSRYELYDEIASGGMARVHFGRLRGSAGFARTVAVKRLHPHFTGDPDFVAMLVDEARLTARIHHPNVVPTLDVVAHEGDILLVMEYVAGETAARLMRAAIEHSGRVPPKVAAAIVVGALHGLHAAHEVKGDDGTPLEVVHRDVSPQNVIVGVDGVPRVADFGIARAVGRSQLTREGQRRGKPSYMAPEQLLGGPVSRRTDVYAAGVVLWELLTGSRLFGGENADAIATRLAGIPVDPPSHVVSGLAPAFDAILARALDHDPAARFPTARAMALELERSVEICGASELGEWVVATAGPALAERAAMRAAFEARPVAPGPAAPTPVATRVVTGRQRGSRTAIVAAGVGVVALGVGVSVGASRRAPAAADSLEASAPLVSSPLAASPLASSPEVSSPRASAPEVSSPRASAPEVSSPAAEPNASSPSSTPRAAPLAAAGSRAERDAKKGGPRAAPPAAGKSAACSPPYTVDADGFHHMKRECL